MTRISPSVSSSVASISVIDAVLGFIRNGNLLKPSKPGFSHALKLSFNTLSKDKISIGPNSLTYRYSFCNHVPKPTVGLFVALMDELSTDACFRVGLPSAPGTTLQMQTEVIDNNNHLPLNDIDIINTVTKLGRKISHTRTEFVCTVTHRTLAHASQVKYMPTGNWAMDMIFGNKAMYKLYEYLVLGEDTVPPIYEEKHLIKDVLLSNLEIHKEGISGGATFSMNEEHTNPFGAMHGGCHAMLMEIVGLIYAQNELNGSQSVLLKAIQVEYLKAAMGSTITIICETIGKTKNEVYVRVLLKRKENGRIFSEGKLRFVSCS